jgi:hypothetical protein
LRKKRKLRVSRTVLRRIFGLKRDKITEERRRLHNEELYDLYSSPDIMLLIKLRRLKWAVKVGCMGETTGACRVLMGKS